MKSALFVFAFVAIGLLSGNAAAQPFVDDFERYPLGSDASSVWENVYHYEDEYSRGGAVVVQDDSQALEVSRSYLWRNAMGRIFFSKIKVTETSNEFDWYGSRLAFANPDNHLERYEVRLNPNVNTFQVNYVDRTGRTGIMSVDELVTTSEVLDSTNCNIGTGRWHYVMVMKSRNDNWNAMLFSWNRPTCHISWQDSRIEAQNPAIGIQSAGKYVTTRFDDIFVV
jgi:hypothetical protein